MGHCECSLQLICDGLTVDWRQNLRRSSRCLTIVSFMLRSAANNKNNAGHRANFAKFEGGQLMKRKPDLLWVLVIVFGLGVVTTGYAQNFWARQDVAPISPVQQP